MAFQKETIIDFSEVRKCPQVALEQMKLCMTSSLLGLISDLWTGNNKDPDVMETYEQQRLKKKKVIHGAIVRTVGMHESPPSFSLSFTYPHTKDCDICLSLVFIDPGMEKWASQFSFNQTLVGISCMLVCVSVCMVDIGCQQILTQTCQGGGAKRARNLKLG